MGVSNAARTAVRGLPGKFIFRAYTHVAAVLARVFPPLAPGIQTWKRFNPARQDSGVSQFLSKSC